MSGPSFDVKQSGQFVNLSNTQGTVGGKLRLEESSSASGRGRCQGDVDCVNGKTLDFDGTATPGDKGEIAGALAGEQIVADLKRDPPDPGGRAAARTRIDRGPLQGLAAFDVLRRQVRARRVAPTR